MGVGKAEFEVQCSEDEKRGKTIYQILNISAHDGEGYVNITSFEDVDDPATQTEYQRNTSEVLFPIDCLDRVIAYLQLIKKWHEEVKKFPIS